MFSRAELCARVWQRDHLYDTRTVEIFIARLRKKLDADAAVPLIHTVRAVGYTLRPPTWTDESAPGEQDPAAGGRAGA